MGVRYNAEKKRIGNYYSTPIYSFRCKCHLCAGWFEIQTDPKNTRYVVTEGAKQQAQDWDNPEEDGTFPASYTREGEGESSTTGDAFSKFEKATTSKVRALTAAERLDEMEQLNDDRWSDPYELNRNLRKALRVHKGKQREKKDQDDDLADKYGLGEGVRLDLVRGDEEIRGDALRASWLSKSEKKEVALSAEDSEEWQVAQLARRKLEQAERDKAAQLSAETGWRDSALVKRHNSMASSQNPTRTVNKSVSTVRAASGSRSVAQTGSAASKLASRLRMNSVKQSDPFAVGLSGIRSSSLASMPSLSGTIRR